MLTLSPETDAEQLRQRNRELSILNAIAEALNRSVDLDQTLDAALAQVAELLHLDSGWIWLLDEENGQIYLAAARRLPPGLVENPEMMQGSCYCLDTYQAGDMEGAANINVITCSRLKKLVGGTDGLRYHASIPLYAHGRQLGVLNVASADWRSLSQDDLRLLYTIGDLLSIAVERARLYAHSAEIGALQERNRLAREIHDTLAQNLAGISLQLEAADALLESGAQPERARPVLQQAIALTRSGLEEARRSVLDLRAAPLEGRSLAQALAALAAALSEKGEICVHCEIAGEVGPLPARVEAGLYRVAQEALTNVEKHARARQAMLSLSATPQAVTLIVADDGQGFAPGQPPAGRFGLVGIQERAHLLGGELHVESSPGAGTRLVVHIPLPR